MNMAVPIFMVIYGYMQTMQFEKKRYASIKASFSDRFFRKLYNIYAPFFIAFLVEWWVRRRRFGLRKICLGLLRGGYGPGSYYVLVLLQLLIIFPVLYFCMKKNPGLTGAGVALLNIVIELLHKYWIRESVYRLLAGRYLTFVFAGMVWYLYGKKVKEYIYLLQFFSLFYLIALEYLSYKPVFYSSWYRDGASVLVFWALALTVAFYDYFPRLPGIFHNLLLIIGQSSYYIFLVQMVWYFLKLGKFGNNIGVTIGINLAVTIGCGIVFRMVERMIEGFLHKKVFAGWNKKNT
jgi:hypothetical protein